MNSLFEKISNWYWWIISQIQYLTWLWEVWSNILFWAIIFYIILFSVFVPLHKHFRKKRIIKEQEIVKDVDEMIYLLAKAQHEMDIDIRKLWWNPNIALMKSIFTKGECDYIKSTFVILDNIHKVESLLWKKVIAIEKESLLIKDSQKYNALKYMEKIFLRIVSIPTLWIYYLFK
jgi:hypothetical protein